MRGEVSGDGGGQLGGSDGRRVGRGQAGGYRYYAPDQIPTAQVIHRLRELDLPLAEVKAIELRSVPERWVAAIAITVAPDDVLPWFDGALAELDAAFPPAEHTGPVGGLYANDLFTIGADAVTVFRAVGAPVAFGRIQPLTLPARELAVAVHAGEHAAIAETYGGLSRWVAERALAADGPVQETWVAG